MPSAPRKRIQLSLFDSANSTLQDSINLTIESLKHYGQFYKHWAIGFSGGKDSTTVVTLVFYLIEMGLIEPPKSLTILYADTRQELPPLHASAMQILEHARSLGFKAQIVVAPLDDRFWVYILGRGVPSPNNGTLRWCTPQIKIEPMQAELEGLTSSLPDGENLLMLTGVRVGESAQRDQRISASCSKDGGECGQGWFQQMTAPKIDTLAPILHWRVCHVWDWLSFEAPSYGYPTQQVADAYGMDVSDGEEPLNARTGCIGCPLVQKDDALDRLIANPRWDYLAPLLRIKQVHRDIRLGKNRHRQPGTRLLKNGNHESNPMRLGPLSLEMRSHFLSEVLAIQSEVNATAGDRPHVILINPEEEARIQELIELKTYPDRWTGDEPMGDEMLDEVLPDGSVQPLLWEVLR